MDRRSDQAATDPTTEPRTAGQGSTGAPSAPTAFDLELGGLAAIVRSSHHAIVTVDRDVRFVNWNAGAEQMFGYRAAEIVGRRAPDVLVPADRIDEAQTLHDRAIAGETIEGVQTQRLRKDGSLVDLELSVYPVGGPDGEIAGMGLIAREITAERDTRDPVDLQAGLLDVPDTGAESAQVDSEHSEPNRRRAEIDAHRWIARVREALDQQAFVLYAQSIIDLRTGSEELRELLLRMTDDRGALIAPGEFLPTAEQFGLIRQIDRWVIDQAARLARDSPHVAFNVSAVSLADPELASSIEAAIRRHGATADAVVCEITETAMVKDMRHIEAFAATLTGIGCGVALDDFGTGFGGFTYLKRVPVSYLKIAAEFIRDLPNSEPSKQIVEAIVKLARGFGQKTIAEGVEDPAMLDLLREMGIDYAQGFGIARPAPTEDAGAAPA